MMYPDLKLVHLLNKAEQPDFELYLKENSIPHLLCLTGVFGNYYYRATLNREQQSFITLKFNSRIIDWN